MSISFRIYVKQTQEDLYTPHTRVLEAFFGIVNVYEHIAPQWLRQKALDWLYATIQFATTRSYCNRWADFVVD